MKKLDLYQCEVCGIQYKNEVTERKRVPENCSTCLYGPNAVGWDGKPVGRIGCGHADRQGDWMLYGMGMKGPCPSFWLDQNRFQRV